MTLIILLYRKNVKISIPKRIYTYFVQGYDGSATHRHQIDLNHFGYHIIGLNSSPKKREYIL